MTIEVGALEQAYAKIEGSYAASAGSGGEALSATDGIRHLELTVTNKNNREPSPEKRGTPDEQQTLPRRISPAFNLSSIMWEPSGTIGVQSNVGKFLEAGFGSKNAISGGLVTTVTASPVPSTTTVGLASITGLAVYDVAVITTANGREATLIKTINVWTTTPPTACTGALAGAGAGNVDNGTHSYKVTFVGASGESQVGAVSNTVTVVDKTMDGKVSLTAIPTGGAGTTSRKIYRTAAGNAVTGPWKLLATIADNVTVVYTDNTADSGLGADATVPTVTFEALSAAPAAGAAFVAGVTYKLASNITQSLAVYKYYNAGGFKQAIYGGVVDQITAMFDGTKEVDLQIQGPAGRYADSTTPSNAPTEAPPQAKPAAHTTVGSPASGMVGNFFVGGNNFPVIAATVVEANNLQLRNKELGTRYASGVAGRANLRKVGVRVTFYMEDTRLLTMATGSSITAVQAVLRCVVGDTNGQMVAFVCRKVEFEIPDIGNEIGPKEVTIEGIALASDGNDQVVFAEL